MDTGTPLYVGTCPEAERRAVRTGPGAEMTEDTGATVPLIDVGVGDREVEVAAESVRSGQLASNGQVEAFEDAFAAFCSADHAVGTSNGTTALHTALTVLGIGDGDRVLTSPFSFVATANAIRLAGAEPVFADIDMETFTLDPHAVRRRIARLDGSIDAILAVHLYGLPAAMDELSEIAAEEDAVLVSDAAQAHGATYEGDPVGSLADVACFSFYPTKNMTTGEGGAVVTDDPAVAERCRQFINHGRGHDGRKVQVGHNFRMTDIAAGIGLVQLEKLPKFNRLRRAHAGRLTDALEGGKLIPPVEPRDRRHVYHQYTLQTQHREALAEHLDAHGIETGVYYDTPIHRQPAYRDYDCELPVAERMAAEALSVPVHPGLSQDEIERVASALKSFSAAETQARSVPANE